MPRGYLPVMPDPSDPRPSQPMLPRQLHRPARGTKNAMPADHRPEVADFKSKDSYRREYPGKSVKPISKKRG